VDLETQHVKAQQNLVKYMEDNGMLKSIPKDIREQLESVAEFAKIMEKQNGEKPKEKPKEEEVNNGE
jgi:spore coat protein CotF